MSKKGNFILGALAGVGIGMLLAPKSGKENRLAFLLIFIILLFFFLILKK